MVDETVSVTVGEVTPPVTEAVAAAGAATVDAQEAQIAASVAEANASLAESAAAGAVASAVQAASLAEAQAAEAMIGMGSRVAAVETRVEETWTTLQAMQAQLSEIQATVGQSLILPPSEAETETVAVEPASPADVEESPAVEMRRKTRRLL